MEKITIYMFDTETAGTLDEPLVYDFGGQPITIKGDIAGDAENTIVDEVYFGMQELMESAYYAEKIPLYEKGLWNGELDVKTIFELRKQIAKFFEENNIKYVCAHNARFDIRALNNTIRVASNGKIKYFFPYGIEVWDTLKMAHQLLSKKPSYVKFCKENNYMTNHKVPRPRLTAEIIYRFLTQDTEFEEAHRGLEDVKIETEIFKYLMSQHKKCNKVLYHAPQGA